MNTGIKLKLFDKMQKKIVPFALSAVGFVVSTTVAEIVNDDNFKALRFTGVKTEDGQEIYEDDLVEAKVDGELIVDVAIEMDGAWRFGGFDGLLCDHPLIRIIGNRNETIWPALEATEV